MPANLPFIVTLNKTSIVIVFIRKCKQKLDNTLYELPSYCFIHFSSSDMVSNSGPCGCYARTLPLCQVLHLTSESSSCDLWTAINQSWAVACIPGVSVRVSIVVIKHLDPKQLWKERGISYSPFRSHSTTEGS